MMELQNKYSSIKILIILSILRFVNPSILFGQIDLKGKMNCRDFGFFDTIITYSGIYKSINFIDYTNCTKENRIKIMKGSENPFTDSLNNYSHLLFINNLISDTLFNIPSMAFTSLKIDTLNKMIIGISNLQYEPYSIIILDFEGNVLRKRDLPPIEIKFNEEKFKEFACLYPSIYCKMLNREYIYKDDEFYYLSTIGRNYIKADSTFRKFKTNHILMENHLLQVLLVVDSDYGICFFEESPIVKLNTSGGKPISLIVKDRNGKNVKIPLKEGPKCN